MEKMERKKSQYIVMAICLFVMFGSRFFPEVPGLNHVGISTLCIFISTMMLLIFVDVTWPLLICIVAYAVSDVYTLSRAIEMSLGHNLFTFVVLNTMMLSVLRDCGLLNRIAVWLITRPFARKNAWRFLLGLFLGEIVLGYFMSCTASMVLFIGLTEQIFRTLKIEKGSRMARLILMSEMFFCGITYGASPIGHPLGIMSIGIFESLQQINYVQFMIVGLLVILLTFILVPLILRFVLRVDVSPIEEFDVDSLKEGIGPVTKAEKISLVIFLVVVILWVIPGVIQDSLPQVYAVLNGLSSCFPPMLGVLAMCIIPVNGKPMMNFAARLKTDASWNAAYPVAIAMINSTALTNPEAGITEYIASVLGPHFNSMAALVFVVIICLVCALLTNFSSPTVAIMLTGTIAFTLMSSGVISGVSAGVLTILLSICASLSFATPCSTYAALVAGSGWVDRRTQFLFGSGMALTLCLITALIAYPFGLIIIG